MRLALLFAAFAASLSRDAALGVGSIISQPFLVAARRLDALAMQFERTARSFKRSKYDSDSMKRRILPNRRHGFLIATQFGGLDYTIQFGPCRSDPKEIFIFCAKSGSASEAIARDAAISASLALQYGVPFDVLRKALTRSGDGGAATIIGHALDLISREMGVCA